jgi:hypothetical protein
MSEQRTQAWIDSATPEQITAAHKAGELANVLAGVPDDPADVAREARERAALQKSEAWVKTATPEQIYAAKEAGHLTRVLSGVTDAQVASEQAATERAAAAEVALVQMESLKATLVEQGYQINGGDSA